MASLLEPTPGRASVEGAGAGDTGGLGLGATGSPGGRARGGATGKRVAQRELSTSSGGLVLPLPPLGVWLGACNSFIQPSTQ